MNNNVTGTHFLDTLASQLNALASRIMDGLFGPIANKPVVGNLTWADIGILACFLLLIVVANSIAAFFVRRKTRHVQAESPASPWRSQMLIRCARPLYLLLWIYGVYFGTTLLVTRLSPGQTNRPLQQVLDKLLDFGVFCILCRLFFQLTRVLEARLTEWAAKSESKLDDILVPLIGKALRVLGPVLVIVFMLPVIGLPPAYSELVSKGSSLLIIGSISWILFAAVGSLEQFVLGKYDISATDNLQARKVHTQVKVISKTVYFVISIVSIASALMLFEEVRRVGTSILASAGVLGLIVGFAAQKTIANLFAGFQLAMTQPIRLDDVVIVESEWGRVEEITLTYVIVHIWDDRRLVLPLSYFIEKPFQNWTRASANLLGSVFLWVDYTLPMAELRLAVQKIVEGCEDWDRRYWNLQVTDASERSMQIRILATAADSGKSWNLRCEIREKLIELVQRKHPQSLPKVRAELTGDCHLDGLRKNLPTDRMKQ